MTCEEVERDELAERYVLDRLEKRQRAAFEDHYFNCSVCLERLHVVEEVCTALSDDTAPTLKSARWRWRRIAAGLAAAAALILSIRVGQDMWGESPALVPGPATVPVPAPATPVPSRPASLGAIALPPYTPPRLRSAPSEGQRLFSAAMRPYVNGDCEAAASGLRQSLRADPSLIQARFYLAACDLQSGNLDDAGDQLQHVIAAGESPYLEDAHFLVAKVRIRRGDIAGARQELTRVVALKGDRREEAQQLLEQLSR